MISKFVREQKKYTQRDLCNLFECAEERAVYIIRRLKEYGLIRAVRAGDSPDDAPYSIDEEIEISDVKIGDQKSLYAFTFVGVIVISGIVLKCYPKYISKNDEPKDELCRVLKVLEKYNSRRQIIRTFSEGEDVAAFNPLAVLLFLLNDYYENGVYSNTEDILENNGLGEILWDRTINETFSIISNNRPYYIDLKTRRRVNNEFDYMKRLHECILTMASKELYDADLLDIFEISGVHLSSESIEDFGDRDYILYRIEKELNVQFNTRKQILLKALYAYLNNTGNLGDSDAFSCVGTSNFNLVWEDVCASILNNQINQPLGSLNLPVPLQGQYDEGEKLIDIIDKPVWSATGRSARDTLIPDLVCIFDSSFIIFDAKYYNPVLEFGKPPKAQPGIESITKQYLYQLAYQQFIKDHKFSRVENCFLIPTEETETVDKGEVSMRMLSALGLKDIKVRLLPANTVYGYYLSGKRMNITALGL